MFYTSGLTFYIPMIIFSILSIIFVIIANKKYKNATYEQKLKPIQWVFFALVVFEIVKIFLLIGRDGEFRPLRYPLVFCSLVLYAYPLFCFKKTRFSEIGKAFSIIPAFIAGIMFAIVPGSISFGDPLISFITLHSFFFHFAMASIAVYMIVTKIYDFDYKKHYSTFLTLAAYITFAVTVSLFIGGDISIFGPNSAYLGFIYNLIGYIPGNLAVMVVFYILSMLLYKTIDIFKKRKAAKITKSN